MEKFAVEVATYASFVIDLKKLIVSRMLIVANSGGGKSHAIRKLAEVTHGHIQHIIIDTEGEFASLREKFDYVIAAAQGGDALAHPKTAKLLAERLLETGVSAIIDIYELKPHERHAFVRIFLDAMVNAPKSLWHPVLVILDEAHVYAPEKDQSEASGAVADIATRGRKRGFCLVAATQRLAKLSKDVAAELQNKLIGGMTLDVDVKRAASDLGMVPKDAVPLLRNLEPGHFYAFGPAVGREVREVHVGPVVSRHPKAGAKTFQVPKPTDAILKVLPQLADLPKESEQEARTLADLTRELANARRELTKLKNDPVLTKVLDASHARVKQEAKRLRSAVELLMKFIVTINAKKFAESADVDETAIAKAIDAAVKSSMRLVRDHMDVRGREVTDLQRQAEKLLKRVNELLADDQVYVGIQLTKAPAHDVRVEAPERQSRARNAAPVGDGSVKPPHQRLLNAIAWLHDKGLYPAPKSTLAAVAGCSPTSGGYANNLSSMKTEGLIDYPQPGMVSFTDVGQAKAHHEQDDGKSVPDKWLDFLKPPHQRIVRALLSIGGANEMSKEELAQAIEASPTSGGYANNLSSLKTLGAIYYPKPGRVALTNYVIPE